jgi:alpha-L-fucosidase
MNTSDKHYRYRRSTEELAAEVSADFIERAQKEVAALDEVNRQGAYQPTWESLDRHAGPEWFDDAKFGMFLDWGLYSVPGWGRPNPNGPTYPDWYLWDMYEKDETRAYHARTWGAEFRRDDFIPMFDAREYDAAAIVAAAAQAGMKYVVPFCKHHDGFCLWDSDWTFRNAGDMSPGYDLLAPLVAACRRQGLKFGAYFSVEEWEYPLLDEHGRLVSERQWEFFEPRLAPYGAARLEGRIAGKVPVRDFVREYIIPQCKELIDRYDPDLLWYDGEWKWPTESRGTRDLAAYYYNRAAGRKEVAVNDRYGDTPESRGHHGDFFTSEFNVGKCQSLSHKWEECRSIGRHYGYNHEVTDNDVLSPTGLVHMLVDIVSRNGNLLLVVNPTGPGALLPMELARLQAVGEWLRVNGEAIYATRQVSGVSPVTAGEGQRAVTPVRFTAGKDGKFIYAIALAWPGDKLVLPGVQCRDGAAVTMLGVERPLQWSRACSAEGGGLSVEIPSGLAQNRPCEHAWVFRIPQ